MAAETTVATPEVVERPHSEIGPSSLDRTMYCLGSVLACRGIPDTGSAAAAEGTRLHDLAEGIMKRTVSRKDITVGDAEKIDGYLNFCSDLAQLAIASAGGWGVEDAVPLWYDAGFEGYIDFWTIEWGARTLDVVDLKTGQIYVPANSLQGQAYAISLIEAMDLWDKIDEVRTNIVQPSAPGPEGVPERISVYTIPELQATKTWIDERVSTLKTALESGEHLDRVPSEKACRFCRFAPQCPELRAAVEEVSVAAFKEAGLTTQASLVKSQKTVATTAKKKGKDVEAAKRVAAAKQIQKLTPAKISALLERREMITIYLKAAEAYAMEHIEEFPKFTVGYTSPNRRWVGDEDELIGEMRPLLPEGVEPAETKRTVLSPAQFEKQAKGLTVKDREAFTAAHTSRPPGQPKLISAKK